jgi:hypothetical protein
MLVHNFLYRAVRRQHDQPLSIQSGPSHGASTKCRILIRAYHYQGKTKKWHTPNAGRGRKHAQTHVEFARLNHLQDDRRSFVEQLNAKVWSVSAELFDGLRDDIGGD